MMCGIDEAIRLVREAGLPETVVNRLDWHRRQAEGLKPKYYKADSPVHSYYTCRNCGARLDIQDNYCGHCGFMVKWDSTRCLTGLPLVDAAEGGEE